MTSITVKHPSAEKATLDQLLARYTQAEDTLVPVLEQAAQELEASLTAAEGAGTVFSEAALDAITEMRQLSGLGPLFDKENELLTRFDQILEGVQGINVSDAAYELDEGALMAVIGDMPESHLSRNDQFRQDIANALNLELTPELDQAIRDIRSDPIRYENGRPIYGNPKIVDGGGLEGFKQFIQDTYVTPGREAGGITVDTAAPLQEIRDQLALLETEQDATVRQQILDNAMSTFNQYKQGVQFDLDNYERVAQGMEPIDTPEGLQFAGITGLDATRQMGESARLYDYRTNVDQIRQAYEEDLSAFETGLQETVEGLPVEKDLAYTEEQLLERLQQVPGFQTEFERGQEAITRAHAATGQLGSGQGLLDMQEFSQGLIQNTYQDELNRLNQVAGLGMPFLQQQQSNAAATANLIGSASAQAGQYTAGLQQQLGLLNLQNQQFNVSNQQKAEIARQQAQLDLFRSVALSSGGLQRV